jgi:hypothetical protein
MTFERMEPIRPYYDGSVLHDKRCADLAALWVQIKRAFGFGKMKIVILTHGANYNSSASKVIIDQ